MKPEKMKITIGLDHAGVDYKSEVVEFLEKEKHEVLDVAFFSRKCRLSGICTFGFKEF